MLLKPNRISLILITSVFLLSLTLGCTSGKKDKEKQISDYYPTHTQLLYAEGFRIDKAEDHTRVTILNPWSKSDKPYAVYYLYPTLPDKLRSDGISLQVPIKSSVVNSFPYLEFLSLLGASNIVKGVTDGFRIYNPDILERIAQGDIRDLGDPFQPNPELLMALQPDVVINSAYAQRDK